MNIMQQAAVNFEAISQISQDIARNAELHQQNTG
jgi:hypothetical protein